MSKRAMLPALMITLLLSACGGSGAAAEARLEARRDTLAAAAEISFTAEVTADLGDEVFTCTLACTGTPEAVAAEVLAPENVAGVTVSVRAGETFLRYGDVQLAVGAAGTAGTGPLAAVPLLFRALRSGHIIRAWTEKAADGSALLAAEIYADDALALTMWFDGETLAPLRASVSDGGMEALRCTIRDFSFA